MLLRQLVELFVVLCALLFYLGVVLAHFVDVVVGDLQFFVEFLELAFQLVEFFLGLDGFLVFDLGLPLCVDGVEEEEIVAEFEFDFFGFHIDKLY